MNSARWRRELPLVAAALFIAFSIWLIAKQNTQDSRTLKVPVRVVNIPPNVDLRYSPLQIPITVHFPQDQAIDVDVQHFEVVLDVQEMFGSDLQSWAGIEAKNAHKVRVTKDHVRTIALAPSVQVTSVGPPEEVIIEAELYTRWLQVHVPTTGELPPRYELDERGIRPDPDRILVTAPFEILQGLDQARIVSAPVDLTGRVEDGDYYPALELPPGVEFVREEDGNLRVLIGIREIVQSRVIADVPIEIIVLDESLELRISPPVVQVTVQAKYSIIDRLDAGSFRFKSKTPLPEQIGFHRKIELEIDLSEEVPAEIREHVRIEDFEPKTVEVEFASKIDSPPLPSSP